MDENETVEQFADGLATEVANMSEAEVTEVMQDMRSGGYFFEASTSEGKFLVLVTEIPEEED